MNKKKWQIDNLTDRLEFKTAARLILRNRMAQVQEDIKNYFITESVEGLHRVRISLRRLRYSMELFVSSFDKKKFTILYKKVEALQDLSGRVRDYDVMKENMNLLSGEENVKINKKVFRKVDELRTGYYNELKLELMKYLHSKAVKNFETLLE
jgi:CHAD domain-containing protein